MDKNDLMKLLNNVQGGGDDTPKEKRIIMIDALNLFFRNFAVIGTLNSNGAHVGGLGGFFRSLGALIKNIEADQVYVVFDGIGGSESRKNIIPEYKSGRRQSRITNWEAFDSVEDENDSQIDQIQRIAQYLKTLPVRTIQIDKVEADDVIAYMGVELAKDPINKIFIVSSDKDYLQLVQENLIVYRPIEKKYYTPSTILDSFGCSVENFILFKLLMGDGSDKIEGLKGLGPKKLYKFFPELRGKKLGLDGLLELAESKLGEHILYARLLSDPHGLEKKYKVMDLSKPMIDKNDKKFLDKFMIEPTPEFLPKIFLKMYNTDNLGNLIRNVDVWLKERFEKLV
jgi:DNA polymerase-1